MLSTAPMPRGASFRAKNSLFDRMDFPVPRTKSPCRGEAGTLACGLDAPSAPPWRRSAGADDGSRFAATMARAVTAIRNLFASLP